MLTAGMSTRAVACEFSVHFSTISRLQRCFRQSGSTSNRPHNRRPCVTTPGPLSVRNRLREAHLHSCRLHRGLDLPAVHLPNRLELANAHIQWHLARWRGVLSTHESWFSLFRADGRQRAWRRVGEQFADVNIVDRVAHGGGGVMVWAGVCYGQRTQVHFIDGILNAQRYRDEIPRSIVVPFIHDHHLMLQHDKARPHVARIWTQFLEAENIPVLVWPANSPDMSPIEHVWDALDTTRLRYVYDTYMTACSSSCQYPATWHRSGPSFHRPRSTTWSTLCEGDVKQRVVTPDTDRFSDPQYSKPAHFRVACYCGSLRHTCAIIMPSNQHLDMPHLWGGWIISAEKCSLTQI